MVGFINDKFRTYASVVYPDCVYIHDKCIKYEMVFPEEFYGEWHFQDIDLSHLYDGLNFDNDDYLIGYVDYDNFDKEVIIIVDTFIDGDGCISIEGYLDKEEVVKKESEARYLVDGINKLAAELGKNIRRI